MQEEIDKAALTREFVEKAKITADFFKKNRLYAFREPVEVERLIEIAIGEKIWTPPNPKQKELLDAWLNVDKKVFTFTGGNRGGKTTILVVICLSVLFGKWLWNDEKIIFPHNKHHRKVRLLGQSWESQIKAVIIPKIKEWWPNNRPVETKKNNQGVEYFWKDIFTGSTLEIMSNSQASDVMEGEDNDLIGYDEPPERDNRIACARGLMDRGGRELFAATLIKHAWVHREVIKARLPDGRPDPSVFNVNIKTRDNIGYGLTENDIEEYRKKLKPEEIEARIEGKPSYLSTLVYEKFDRNTHIKKPFKIPLDWIVDISIDFHPSKPWAVVFLATAKNNFKYIFKELWKQGNPKFIAEEIIRAIRDGCLRVGRCTIDPLAKSGEINDNDVFSILYTVLGAHKIMLEVASKDKDNGIALVNNLLWTENEMPGLFFFEDCVKTIQQVEDLMYDVESLKPTAMKVEDDFTECLYRLTLLDTQWYPEIVYDVKQQKSVLL